MKKLNDVELQILVMEAIDLDRTVQAETERLKEMKAKLVEQALLRSEDALATDGGGWSLMFDGAEGSIARVTQPGEKLKASIDATKKPGQKVMTLVGKHRETLFIKVVKYAPVPDFRALLGGLFNAATKKKILRICESESTPTVGFETKEVA